MLDPLESYFRLLTHWNSTINLTALPLNPPTDETFDRLLVEPLCASRQIPDDRSSIWFDLGSGGGIDVLLSAKRVGPSGWVYGLDMTDEMLSLARENQQKSGLANVTFLKGEIEQIPLPNDSVDVIVSNCVINLSADKDRVIAEAFRVLKPGGRLAVSDVVVRGEAVPDAVRRNMELWVGCVAGALEESSYRDKLARAGFERTDVEPTRVYRAADARQFLEEAGLADDATLTQIDGRFMSAFIRARKPAPAAKTCCSSTCCA